MAELKVGTKFYGDVPGVADRVVFEVTALLPGGMVELTSQTGYKQQLSAARLMGAGTSYSMGVRATAPVAGLQVDPPHHIARLADKGIVVLPSPVAPETNKSGIVATGEVKVLGTDGFLHVIDEQSIPPTIIDEKTKLVRED